MPQVQVQVQVQVERLDLEIKADCNSDDDCMSQSEQSNRSENSSDWGHFAEFQDEEPRPGPPLNVVEKGSLFQQRVIDFYTECRRIVEMKEQVI
mmetsp:Transcript_4533/g.6921  ORF Transcript_4533/g.6921 Transcript_4533/m.6921 type:complete len:94 (-) Transcript_4533:88-369(-)